MYQNDKIKNFPGQILFFIRKGINLFKPLEQFPILNIQL